MKVYLARCNHPNKWEDNLQHIVLFKYSSPRNTNIIRAQKAPADILQVTKLFIHL